MLSTRFIVVYYQQIRFHHIDLHSTTGRVGSTNQTGGSTNLTISIRHVLVPALCLNVDPRYFRSLNAWTFAHLRTILQLYNPWLTSDPRAGCLRHFGTNPPKKDSLFWGGSKICGITFHIQTTTKKKYFRNITWK